MPLHNCPRETFTGNVPSTFLRKPYPPFLMDTVAMHWDGTYRDRVWGSEDEFWGDLRSDDYSEIIVPAGRIAEHLAAADA